MTDTKRLQKDVRALVGKDAPAKTLAPRDAAAPLSAAVGTARPSVPGSGSPSGAAGIRWPLTETSAGDRTYSSTITTISSPDGFFTVTARKITSMQLVDAAGSQGSLNLDGS